MPMLATQWKCSRSITAKKQERHAGVVNPQLLPSFLIRDVRRNVVGR